MRSGPFVTPIKAVVDFYSREVLRKEGKPHGRFESGAVENATPPVLIVPSAGADVSFRHTMFLMQFEVRAYKHARN